MIETIKEEEVKKSARKMITDEDLLEFLSQFYEENHRIPTMADLVGNEKYPSFNKYIKRFGSWKKALELAKLDTVKRVRIGNKELLDSLKKFYDETGRVPEMRDFDNNHKYPGKSIYSQRFGSWNKALRLAGLDIYRHANITDEELSEFLIKFEIENGRPPTCRDLNNNHNYPSIGAYIRHFGKFEDAKKIVGQDIDSMVRKGIIETTNQKSRLAEILVLKHFPEKGSIDISGDNCTSAIDGICPKGQVYDVKSSGLLNGGHYYFNLDKGGGIDCYYLLAFNDDWTKLLHVWRIPWNFIEEKDLSIGYNNRYAHNLENMKNYEITEKFSKLRL